MQDPLEPDRNSYGTADVSPYGIDRSQLRANLKLTPAQRLEKMVQAANQLLPLRGIARRQSKR